MLHLSPQFLICSFLVISQMTFEPCRAFSSNGFFTSSTKKNTLISENAKQQLFISSLRPLLLPFSYQSSDRRASCCVLSSSSSSSSSSDINEDIYSSKVDNMHDDNKDDAKDSASSSDMNNTVMNDNSSDLILKPENATDRFEMKSVYKDIYSVALPSLAACIVEPALSLVDTFFVGKAGSFATLGLAGMSINSALFNIIAAATAPLGTGTTAVISKLRGLQNTQLDLENTQSNSEKPTELETNILMAMTSIVSPTPAIATPNTAFLNGISFAVVVGAFLSTLILLLGKPFIGKAFQIQDQFLMTTVNYFKIRGLSLPSVLLNYIVFGFSIAMQDVTAPILSIVIAFIVNFFGDYLLVERLKCGLSGAAVATTVSSYVGASIALYHLFKKYKIKIPSKDPSKIPLVPLFPLSSLSPQTPPEILAEIKNSKLNQQKSGLFYNFRNIAWNELFNKKGMGLLFSVSGPLFIGSIVNTLIYSAGARIASFTSNPAQATVEIAAHQIVMQTWWFLSYFSSPFSLVAQAVIPKDIMQNNNKRVRRMVQLLLQITGIVGISVTMINVTLIVYFPNIFTRNIEIQKIVKTVLIPSSISLFIICLTTVSDGLFIGFNLINDYLTASILSTSCAWLYYIFSIKNKLGIDGAWNGLLVFSVVRMTYYLSRFRNLWSLTRDYKEDEKKLLKNS